MGKCKSTLRSIFLINIIGAIFFSFLINGYYYRVFDKTIRTKTIQENELQDKKVFEAIDLELNSIVNIGAIYLADKQNVPRDGFALDSVKIRSMIESLNKIVLTFPAVVGIDQYFPDHDLIITNGQNFHFLYNEDPVDMFLPWLNAYLDKNSPSAFLSYGRNRYPISQDEVVTLVIKYPLFAHSFDQVMALHMSPKLFTSYLSQSEGTFLIFDRNGTIVYQNADLPSDISFFTLCDGSTEFRSQIVTIDNQNYYLASMPSNTLGLTYVRIASASNVFNRRAYTVNFILSSAFFLFQSLVVMLFLAFRSDTVYSRRLVNATQPLGFENKKKQKRFDDALIDIEDQFTSLHSKIESSEPILLRNALRLTLFGLNTSADYQEIRSKLPESHILLLQVLSANHMQATDFLSTLPSSIHWLSTTISHEYVIVLNADGPEMDTIFPLIEKCRSKHADVCTVFASSIKEMSEENLKTALEELEMIHSYRYILPVSNTYFYDDLTLAGRTNMGELAKLVSTIESSLRSEDLVSFDETMKEIVSACMGDVYTVEYVKGIARDLVSMLNQSFSEKGIEPRGILGYDLKDYCEHIPHIQVMAEWYRSSFLELTAYLNQKREVYGKDNIREKINELLKNCDERELTLDFLADRLDLRADELSRAFKMFYGENFSDYLRRTKIKRAKKLLEEGCLVKDVAEMVGYSTAQYFIKVFKSETGETPNQYKNRMEG